MDFPGLNRYLSGVAVPVTALRDDFDVGTGEFADLPEMGRFLRSVGLRVLQVLPVNDTGYDPSPYSALSAYALHPIYLRISDLPELEIPAVQSMAHPALQNMHEEARQRTEVEYEAVLQQKLQLLRRIYAEARSQIAGNAALSDWISANRWVKPYAVFRLLKDRNEQRAWWEWSDMREPTAEAIDRMWEESELHEELLFYAWVQWRLEQQLQAAAGELDEMGVYFKGDLPILMNEDSADVWLHRSIFRRELRAGAPPDMFSQFGQNWGFPIYDWEELAKQDYGWWRDRLRQADKFFHMFRIDHVLGFFRIWAVPQENVTGTMGYFIPGRRFSYDELRALGFDEARIAWLAEPHITGEQLRQDFGEQADRVAELCLMQLPGEDLYKLHPRVTGERWLMEVDLEDELRDKLLLHFADRALIPVDAENGREFAPAWAYRNCWRYETLLPEEKERLEAAMADAGEESEKIWEQHGREVLGFMQDTVGMLPCAEDLGAVPNCVPHVLRELGILGLRVPRWTKDSDDPAEPLVPPERYPTLTVCAASVHDTSTIRGWWYEDKAAREELWNVFGFEGPCPEEYDEATAYRVLERISEAGSAVCVFQIQDLLALNDSLLPENRDHERINIPGTVGGLNWKYRLQYRPQELSADEKLCRRIKDIVNARPPGKPVF